jgi:hypothetical protein
MAPSSLKRLRRPASPRSSGSMRAKMRSSRPPPSAWPTWGSAFIHCIASQGVTTNAIASDRAMPIDALIGIGLM